MFSHAEYHSTYPLPICGTVHGGAREFTPPPEHCVRRVVQDMGDEHNYPKTRKPKVYTPRDRAAEHRKRIQKMAADLRANTYSFMDGMGWITIKTMAELRNIDECNIGRSIKLLVADKVVQKKMLGKTALYRWVNQRKDNQAKGDCHA